MSARNVIDFTTAYPTQGRLPVVAPGGNQQLFLYFAALVNRCGTSQDCALAILLAKSAYAISQRVALSVPQLQADYSASLASGAPVNIFDTTNNDGILVGVPNRKFNVVGLNISTAQAGGVYAFEYWNGAAWVALPDVIITPDFTSLGATLLMFSAPFNWASGTDAGTGGLSSSYYIRISATTAAAAAVVANDAWVAKWFHFFPQVPNNTVATLSYDSFEELRRKCNSGEGILPLFSTANAKNLVTVQYQSF